MADQLDDPRRPEGADVIGRTATLLGDLVERGLSLATLCTYRVGGPAALFAQISDVEDLDKVHRAVTETGCPVMVVGKGSNLLVSSRGFAGLVLQLGDAFDYVEIDAESEVVAAGGATFLPIVARKSVLAGLSGFEWAVGVPGSVGGAVRMNAGGHGSDIAASLISAELYDVVTGEVLTLEPAELKFGYRTSAVEPHHIVLTARFQLAEGDTEVGQQELSEIVRWRRTNQPGGQNAGSVFTNPDGDSAGRLIDAAGLKGFRVGSASVSEKHANFIQADPNGDPDDVYRLIAEVRRIVQEQFGVTLHAENLLVGFDEGTVGDARSEARVEMQSEVQSMNTAAVEHDQID